MTARRDSFSLLWPSLFYGGRFPPFSPIPRRVVASFVLSKRSKIRLAFTPLDRISVAKIPNTGSGLKCPVDLQFSIGIR